MQELDKRISLLRLLLADLEGKRSQLQEMESQYAAQLAKIVEFVVYREGDVGNALSLMQEVQSKLDEVVQTQKHLALIAQKAGTELEVLVMTKRVAEARSQLARLEERQQELSERLAYMSGLDDKKREMAADSAEMEDIRAIHDEVEREIVRLNSLISEVSERAARSIQGKGKAH
jgi:hypothetical protein